MLLVAFQEASRGSEAEMQPHMRITVLIFFWAVVIFKLMVLLVSLPPNRPPPRNRRARRFFIADQTRLAKHLAEALAMAAVLTWWCLTDELPLHAYAPIGIGALILVVRLSLQYPPLLCLARIANGALSVAFMPFLAVARCIDYVVRHPRRVRDAVLASLHPLKAEFHALIAVIAGLLSTAFVSCTPVVVFWLMHAGFMLAAVTEKISVHRLAWRRGPGWWYAMMLAAISVYTVNAAGDFDRGFGEPDHIPQVVFCASTAWLLVFCSLGVAVNWERCLRRYRQWQQRHGTFTLTPPAHQIVRVNTEVDV